jgi:predicted phosphoadenosine phosphosulfate sulfurtransferase
VIPGTDVLEAARGRVRWLFEEFEGKVCVNVSGGKDSTVIAELAIGAARDLGCLPVRMMWLDQECEYQATVDYMRRLADRPEVVLDWYQVPFKLFNASNHEYPWLNVWGEGEEWMRAKEPDAIHVNDFGTDRFTDLLHAITERMGGVHLSGIRGEESPSRLLLIGSNPGYKWATWTSGGPPKRGYWMAYPIHDWFYQDVWKAIYDNGWAYNEHYNFQFRYGVPIRNMRVSNFHHETALHHLAMLQEAEPATWEAATRRLRGINALGQVQVREWVPPTLPYMFKDWAEYVEHLIDTLVPAGERETYRKLHAKALRQVPWLGPDKVAHQMARVVIGSDLYGTTLGNWLRVKMDSEEHALWRAARREARA